MEDKQEHGFRDALVTVGAFGIGYSLRNNYLKQLNLSKNQGAAIGVAFALIPTIFNEDQNKITSLVTAGSLAALNINSDKVKKIAINNLDLFENTIVNLKKINKTQADIKEFFIESKQKLMHERKKDTSLLEGFKELGEEVYQKFANDKKISKSKAYDLYEELSKDSQNLSFEEFQRLGKKIPFQYADYINSRRKLERVTADSKLGSTFLTTLGYFSKINNKGRLSIDAEKFITEDANNIRSKIDILDTVPKIFTNNKGVGAKKALIEHLDKEGLGEVFTESLEQGSIKNKNQVTYKQFMDLYGKQLFATKNKNLSKYFDENGNAKYMDILGNQVFSDNLMKNDKGKLLDATWLNPKNYALDLLKGVDSSIRPFFKSLPFSDNKQFPIFDAFGLETKIYNSIHGNQMDKLFIEKGSNVDMLKTKRLLDQQINRMRHIKNEEWRKANGYRSISQALSKSNEIDNVYNPKIKTEKELEKAITLLEYKSTRINDLVNKTNGVLKRSSLVGFDDVMDKSYNKYFIHMKDGKMSVMERKENTFNSFFFNNEMYIRKNGVFEKQRGKYALDLSRQTRIIQAKRNGEYFTTRADKVGKYVEESEVPEHFSFSKFRNLYEEHGSGAALKYAKDTDFNALPYFGKNGYKDSDNILEEFRNRSDKIRNYLKINGKGDRDTASILSLTLGIDKQNKSFFDRYNQEIDEAFDKMIVKYKKGMEDIASLVENNDVLLRRLNKELGTNKIKNSERYLSALSTSRVEKIVSGADLTDDMKSALKMQRAFEISSDKYKIANEYKSIVQVGTDLDEPIKKRLGPLFNSSHFKEDIITNTFSQEKNYTDFKNIYGNLFENNLMFHEETLFNKNRITNINTKVPSIVKKAFTGSGIDELFKTGDIKEFSNNIRNTENPMGTNLGMYLTKGLESFENSLSVLGVPKLGPENMDTTVDYFANIYMKRIMPFYMATSMYGMLNSGVDAVLPDSTPIFGQGLTAAAFKGIASVRMGIQILINGIGLGAVARKFEEMFPGMGTDNGLLSPLQLSYTNEDMYAVLFEGKEVEDRKNRFWYSSGRQKFSGGEIQNIRPSLLYLGQQRTAGIFDNKVQRFFRQDFLPTKLAWTLIDPYMEERINAERRPVAVSGDVFNTELPIFGGLFNAVGRIIKPRRYFNKDEWYVSRGVMRNPEYDGQENTQEFVNYDTSFKLTQAFSKAIKDTQNIIGMRGYVIGQGLDYLTGKDSLDDRIKLETLNDGYSIQDKYENLNLGGMFGTTEPIRRILGSEAIDKTISPLRNNSLPDWMPKNYFKNVSFGNVYNEIPFGEFILPGEVYQKYNKLHPDDTGEYGVADRLKILSKVAPFSKEFRHTKEMALKRIDSMSKEERQIVYQSLNYAEKWRERDIDKNNRKNIDTESRSVTIKRMENPFEFYGSDNKRYKLSGIGLEFLGGKNNKQITNEVDELRSILKKGSTLNGYIAENPLNAVKTDNAGEYIELYVPELDKFKNLKKESSLRYSVNSDYDITDTMWNAFKNAKKPASLEKIWGSKDTYARYYYENILDPSFKNWETPVESFINPILDTASTGTRPYLASMNTAIRMGDFGDPIMPVLTTGAYIKGMLLGPNKVNRIERENELKNMIEYSKSQLDTDSYRGNFNSSIYNMTKEDGLSKMKNYLTNTEKKYLDYVVNEEDEDLREKMYDVSSDRMKKVLNNLWERQAEYNGGSYDSENIELPTYNEDELSEYNNTNNMSYNETLFKYEMGFDLTSYEQQSLSLYGTKHLKEYKRKQNIAEYIDNMMGKGGNQKILSTIMGEDMLVFGY